MFRCFYVPMFCKTVIEWYVQQEGRPRYWLWEHGTYFLAFERMLMEMDCRKVIQPDGAGIKSLADPALDYCYWLRRFEQWRGAAEASYRYFIKKQSPQIRKSARPQAAHLGTLKNLSGGQLPEDLFAGMLAGISADAVAMAAFNKTAKKIKPARWGEESLDTWLIEVWPLVTEYGWNYNDVWLVALKKWESPEAAAFDTSAAFSDRCKKMLRLKLSTRGAARQGRPKSVGEFDSPILAPLAPLAISVRSIGDDEEEWIRGEF